MIVTRRGRRFWMQTLAMHIALRLRPTTVDGSYFRGGSASSVYKSCEDTTTAPAATTMIWEEEVEDDDPAQMHDKSDTYWSFLARKRLLDPAGNGWLYRVGNIVPNDDRMPTASVPQPHPLRTNLWELNVRWRGQAKRQKHPHGVYKHEELLMEFDPSGYVRIGQKQHDNEECEWMATGRWNVETTSVEMTIALPQQQQKASQQQQQQQQQHSFAADFHVNPFGKHAKFTRGTIRIDDGSPKWCRPVVATFTGRGVGEDTVDLSYGKRNAEKDP